MACRNSSVHTDIKLKVMGAGTDVWVCGCVWVGGYVPGTVGRSLLLLSKTTSATFAVKL